jgi:hypothetical protein
LKLSLLFLSGWSVKAAAEGTKLYFSDKSNPESLDVILLSGITPKQVLSLEVILFYLSCDQIGEEALMDLVEVLLSLFLKIRFGSRFF